MKVKVKSTPVTPSAPTRLPIPPQRKQGFIAKFVRIIIDDIKNKLYVERARKRNEYEQFCKLARGER